MVCVLRRGNSFSAQHELWYCSTVLYLRHPEEWKKNGLCALEREQLRHTHTLLIHCTFSVQCVVVFHYIK